MEKTERNRGMQGRIRRTKKSRQGRKGRKRNGHGRADQDGQGIRKEKISRWADEVG